MRIALIILHAEPARGGAERYTVDIAQALSHRGHDVSLLSRSFADEVPWEIKHVQIEGGGLSKYFAYASFVKNVEDHLAGVSYDVVHAMLPVKYCDLYHPHAGLAAEAVEEGHLKHADALQPFAKIVYSMNARRRKFAAVESDLLRRTNPPLVICLSDYVKQAVKRFYPLPDSDLATLFNSVDLKKFDPQARPGARTEMRHELKLDPNTPAALMIANDFRRKGLKEAIQAVAKSQEKRLHLIVVGKQKVGAYRRLAYASGIGDRVIFREPTPDPIPYYKAADFFLLPTRHDPCSLATLEALCMGLPVISTTYNGATEIMTDGVDGYILPDPWRIAGITKAIDQVLDPRRRKSMAEAALTHRSKLSFEHHLAELLKLYQQSMLRRLRGGQPATASVGGAKKH